MANHSLLMEYIHVGCRVFLIASGIFGFIAVAIHAYFDRRRKHGDWRQYDDPDQWGV
jgi:hypothetical protein